VRRRLITLAATLCLAVGSSLLITDAAQAATSPTVYQCIQQQPVLQVGNRGQCVAALQGFLNLWVTPIDIDGIFGGNTKKAVVKYQKAAGLGQDGVVGAQTWKSIKKSCDANLITQGLCSTHWTY
jgi:peptidoglycan hydrolase-like protein with peptidoglycan-binding domain